MPWLRLWPAGPNAQREYALRKVASGPLHDYLSVPLPERRARVDDLPLLAVDLETTGLDVARDHILSIGFVPVDGTTIRLGGAGQVLVRPPAGVGDSAVIHGITDDAVRDGVDIEEALAYVLPALAGRVLLAHHAVLEMKFLSAACKRVFGHRMPCVRVDTLELQARIVAPGPHEEPADGSVRLWAAREHFGLPAYKAHEALTDALACAELYVAQINALGDGKTLTLGDLG